jgi:hypothetical protein
LGWTDFGEINIVAEGHPLSAARLSELLVFFMQKSNSASDSAVRLIGSASDSLEALDGQKIDEAVRFINRKTILTGLELAREIGQYLLDTFFDGDYQSFADTSRSKKTSFRALLVREDLLLGNATLYRFVRISHQLRALPPDLASDLSLAHHRALLPLNDADTKTELARRALDEGWSSHHHPASQAENRHHAGINGKPPAKSSASSAARRPCATR